MAPGPGERGRLGPSAGKDSAVAWRAAAEEITAAGPDT